MNIYDYKVVLASKSPRRKELLAQVGIEFEILPAIGDEIITSTDPAETVMQLSLQKAKEVCEKCDTNTVIIGADTVVAIDNKILGKPSSKEAAYAMISKIKNTSHSVFTGVTIIFHGEAGDVISNFFCETKVFLYDMTDHEIWEYIESGDPMDKAGAYGIQGAFAAYVKKIDGDYNNVVGLPVSALIQEAKKMEV